MQSPPPILAVWRDEIVVELNAAKAEALQADAELIDATEAARVARTERRALNDAFGRLDHRQSFASALAIRKHARDTELQRADGRVSLAKQAAKTAALRMVDLQQALGQLEQIAPHEAPAVESDAAEQSEMLTA